MFWTVFCCNAIIFFAVGATAHETAADGYENDNVRKIIAGVSVLWGTTALLVLIAVDRLNSPQYAGAMAGIFLGYFGMKALWLIFPEKKSDNRPPDAARLAPNRHG